MQVAYKSLMIPSAIAALVVYAFGEPVVFFWRLRMHKEVLAAKGPLFQLGFLYRDYAERYYFFECVELVRKFLLCGMLRFVDPGSATQIIIGIVFCVVCANCFSISAGTSLACV